MLSDSENEEDKENKRLHEVDSDDGSDEEETEDLPKFTGFKDKKRGYVNHQILADLFSLTVHLYCLFNIYVFEELEGYMQICRHVYYQFQHFYLSKPQFAVCSDKLDKLQKSFYNLLLCFGGTKIFS